VSGIKIFLFCLKPIAKYKKMRTKGMEVPNIKATKSAFGLLKLVLAYLISNITILLGNSI
jgi:hypothetical protein